MERRIAITSFGSNIARAFVEDVATRPDVSFLCCDADPQTRLSAITNHYAVVPRGDDPRFVDALFDLARRERIAFIIPGSDEDAFALMTTQDQFRAAGVDVAVQHASLLPAFATKTAMYTYLTQRGFPVPEAYAVRSVASLDAALGALGYPDRPVLMKPNAGRGGHGVAVLSTTRAMLREPLPVLDRAQAVHLLDGAIEYVCMVYEVGTVYDIDVLTYANGRTWFGSRRRFTNVTARFSGNAFDWPSGMRDFVERCYAAFPTRYLVDYDVLITEDGRLVLLEINPRPSGSTVSYLPFGANCYDILAQSYLNGIHSEIRVPDGATAYAFLAMVSTSAPLRRATPASTVGVVDMTSTTPASFL